MVHYIDIYKYFRKPTTTTTTSTMNAYYVICKLDYNAAPFPTYTSLTVVAYFVFLPVSISIPSNLSTVHTCFYYLPKMYKAIALCKHLFTKAAK